MPTCGQSKLLKWMRCGAEKRTGVQVPHGVLMLRFVENLIFIIEFMLLILNVVQVKHYLLNKGACWLFLQCFMET